LTSHFQISAADLCFVGDLRTGTNVFKREYFQSLFQQNLP